MTATMRLCDLDPEAIRRAAAPLVAAVAVTKIDGQPARFDIPPEPSNVELAPELDGAAEDLARLLAGEGAK